MIKLVDFLNIKDCDLKNYKIHFAIGTKDKLEPYQTFLIGDFDEWQSVQANRNFNLDYVISLIYCKKDVWMFAGVFKVCSQPKTVLHKDKECWKYTLEKTDTQNDMIGRAFVEYNKNFRASYPSLKLKPKNGEALKDMCIVSISEKRATINDFEGFDKINVTYQTLKYIIDNDIQSWKSALSNVKGIYLISDTKSGKQYVGSAYGDECIWQRWQAYAKTGHGGNVELKNLLEQNGIDYKNNFRYAVLEVCNMNLGNEYIIARESYWKDILMTRKFGLNSN